MSDPRWTDETRDLVAHGLHDRLCIGRWDECNTHGVHWGDARELLAALADAGLLVEPGGETEGITAKRCDYSDRDLSTNRRLRCDLRADHDGDHKAFVPMSASAYRTWPRLVRAASWHGMVSTGVTGVPHLPAEPAPVPFAEHERIVEAEMAERDLYCEAADALAAAISRLTGVDIGEHSSMNDPWRNALDAAEAAPGQPEERADAADELDEALAGAMSAIEWAANHISWARSCARAALGSTPDTGSTDG